MDSYPKKRNGVCVGVFSGDRVLFQGPAESGGGFKQKVLHLVGIKAPKYDIISGNDEMYGYAAREFLRSRLIGKHKIYLGQDLSFYIEKKINQIEVGHIIYNAKDITIDLLRYGYVKLRSDKVQYQHFQQYKSAEEYAIQQNVGLWSDQGQANDAYRYLRTNNKQTMNKLIKVPFKAIVQEINPSRAVLYYKKQGLIFNMNFSQVDGQDKSNVKIVKSVLECSFLHRQVEVYLHSYSEDLTALGYFSNQKNQDVRKLLLTNGFAKLAKNAMETVNAPTFVELKKIAEIALQNKKGLWKQQKVTKSENINKKTFKAIVVQVNSGDSITVSSLDTNEQTRVFFPNVRCPSQNQSYAFEAKQFLRKKCIGNKVTVEIQFSKRINIKKFEGDIGEPRSFIFATVINEGANLSTYLLQLGLISIQAPKVEEDISKYFEDLRVAQSKAKQDKKGMHSATKVKPITFNDLSGGKGKKVDAVKCKNMFPLLKSDRNLSGVIEMVLNGSRFKVRLNSQKIIVLMVLDGIRCLPNQGDYKKASEEALHYSKMNVNQRDIDVDLKRVDNKGIYHVSIFINKKDYAVELLQKGYAIYMSGYKYKNQTYLQAETFAKKNKIGLWQYNFNMSALKGQTEKIFKAVNFTKQGILIQVINDQELYIEPENCERCALPQDATVPTNVKVGDMVLAKFSDDVYYRAKILKQIGQQKYHVHFIDFGNYDTVSKNKLGVLPQELMAIKSPIYRVSPYGVDAITKQGINTLQDFIGYSLKVQFKEKSQDEAQYRVILWDKDKCINLQLIQYGEAECSCNDQIWEKTEQKAKSSREGKWDHYDE